MPSGNSLKRTPPNERADMYGEQEEDEVEDEFEDLQYAIEHKPIQRARSGWEKGPERIPSSKSPIKVVPPLKSDRGKVSPIERR